LIMLDLRQCMVVWAGIEVQEKRVRDESNVNLRRRAANGTDAFERLRPYFQELGWGG
jgi:hypothetical protein